MRFVLACAGLAAAFSADGQSLPIVNADFSVVGVHCASGYAYQRFGGCADALFQKQNFNNSPGMGWKFGSHTSHPTLRDGVTQAGSPFNPPPFPPQFTQAAFLQSASFVFQIIPGFVAGQSYTVSFYLGSRYASGGFDGAQHVRVLLGDAVVYDQTLQSYMPFTLVTATVVAPRSGPLPLIFEGLANNGDHTAFFSGVSVGAASE